MRLVVLSSRRLLGESLAAVLKGCPEIAAVGRVAEPESLFSLCELSPPDVVVIDADRAAASVVPVCDRLRARFPAIYPVVLYETLAGGDLTALWASGVRALVPCSRGLSALLATLRSRPPDAPWPRSTGLSARQHDVLMLLGSGHSVIEIADLLGITPGTVENHKRRLYAKLEAGTGVQAVARAVALGLIDERPGGAERPTTQTSAADITAREYDILRSIAQGHTLRETARSLGIAVKTVANAQSQLFRKLGVHNRPSALVAAHSIGLLPDPPPTPAGTWRSVS
jgi:DNA-binding NarL/FixJ family response regulator